MIMIKPFFGDWKEATKEQAKEYVMFTIENATAINKDKINKYINTNKIKGITVEELLEERND